MKDKKGIILTGAVVGIIAVLLVRFGNPANMGFCIACFLRDISGALGLQRAEVVQYIRPEIIGLVLGAFLMAFGKKEFKARGGSSPFIRFILGFIVMIGALMFLGCPLRMVLRIAGGDLNAVVGLAGFVAGIIFFSQKGPGSQHAPLWIALAAGLVVGALAQRTRLCMVGGIRDLVLFKDWYLISGFIAIFAAALIGNAVFGFVKIGFMEQPIAHTDWLWNFLGMSLAGFGSVLLGGCPLRQLILSGEGNIDSVMAVLGMVFGAAFAHNFQLASSAQGPTLNGKIAVIIGLIVVAAIACFNREKSADIRVKGDVKLEG